MNQKLKGFTVVILSAVVFGFMPLLTKLIYAGGGTPFNVVFLRFLIVTPVLLVILRLQKVSLRVTKAELLRLTSIAVLGYGLTALFLFASYEYIPGGMASTIHFTYPIFVILGCIVFYREKINPVKLFSVFLCTIGVALFYDGGSGGSLFGFLLAFLSGATYAFYMVYLEKSGLNEMPPLKLTFYLCLIAAVFMFFFSLVSGHLSFHLTPTALALNAILSLIIGLIAVTFMQIGISLIGSQTTAILSTFEPITSVLIGILVFQETLTIKTLIGCVLILSAVILTTVFSSSKEDFPQMDTSKEDLSD